MRSPRRSAVPTVQPAQFECARCGATHLSRDAQIPPRWSQRPGAILCPDCTPSAVARAFQPRRARP
jgi:predicted RNA-binding Zn-ribbon protein involved in translation (DUF1610 family)